MQTIRIGSQQIALRPINKVAALGWCVGITLVVMAIEFAAAALTRSLMLYSDALHMLSHAFSLGVSLTAVLIAKRQLRGAEPTFETRPELWAALINGVGLIGFSGYIIYEGIVRIFDPVAISTPETFAVAVVGLLVNLLTAVILSASGLEDLNTKSAFMHMLADTFSSVAIVVGTVVIYFTEWFVIDALLSLVVAGVIAKWAIGLVRDATAGLKQQRG